MFSQIRIFTERVFNCSNEVSLGFFNIYVLKAFLPIVLIVLFSTSEWHCRLHSDLNAALVTHILIQKIYQTNLHRQVNLMCLE